MGIHQKFQMNRASFAAALLAVASGCADLAPSHQKGELVAGTPNAVIYGSDDRLDLYEIQDPAVIAAARSTVALVRSHKLTETSFGTTQLGGGIWGVEDGLCKSERFYSQRATAFCSGFLVAPDVIVTAGHCVKTAADCAATKFVFDFALKNASDPTQEVPTSSVYGCSSLLAQHLERDGADYAIVRLDRAVRDRAPVALRTQGTPTVGTPLRVIGHPSGIPTKIAAGAKIRSFQNAFFVADTDTYGGNSGSAVFNAITHEVEGILVRGETDFLRTPEGCVASNLCTQDDCRGEDVTLISVVTPHLPGRKPPQGLVFEVRQPVERVSTDNAGVQTSLEVESAISGAAVRVTIELDLRGRDLRDLQLLDCQNRALALELSDVSFSESGLTRFVYSGLAPAISEPSCAWTLSLLGTDQRIDRRIIESLRIEQAL